MGAPCNVGTPSAGNIAVSYDPTTHAVTMTCVPASQTLTVSVIGHDGTGAAHALPAGTLVTSQPSGISCPGTCTFAFAFNTSVTLSEAPPTGWTFGGWGGACGGTGTTCTVTMSVLQSVSATFVVNPTLNVSIVGQNPDGTVATLSAGVEVTTQPAGISCPGTCASVQPYKSSITLTETPPAGWSFAGWSGDCTGLPTDTTCKVTMDRDKNVTATFIQGFRLALTVQGTCQFSFGGCAVFSGGTVTPSVGGTNYTACTGGAPNTCYYYFVASTTVTLTASNGSFNSWSGDCSGTASTCSVTMSQSRAVTGSFN